jgi:hypothetical protein
VAQATGQRQSPELLLDHEGDRLAANLRAGNLHTAWTEKNGWKSSGNRSWVRNRYKPRSGTP